MDLSESDGQLAVRDAVGALIARHRLSPAMQHRLAATDPGFDPGLWAEVMATGWLTVALPVAVGGGGGGLTDLIVAVEALARGPVPGPIHNGVVASADVLLALGGGAQVARHLVPLVAGARRYAFCLTEPNGAHRPEHLRCRAVRDADGWLLEGAKCFVPHAGSAEVLLVVARTGVEGRDGISVFAVRADAPGVEVRTMATIGGDRQGEVVLAGVRVPAEDLLGRPEDAWPALRPVLDRAVLAMAADMVGSATAALEWTVARVCARHQWGVPIGSLQAVQHRCADMSIALTCARDAVWDAAGRADRGEDLTTAAAGAKALCDDACRRITASAHQLCGGEGIYADQPLHLWYRRVKSFEPFYGGTRAQRAVVAASLLDG